MAQPTVLILRAPGTNCDVESAFAFERAGARTTALHVNRLLEQPRVLRDFQILCLPGGFSYGDDVAAGKILGNQLRVHLAEMLGEFKEAGKLILGICNGFQVLIRTGLLLDDVAAAGAGSGLRPAATLTWNDSGRFEDRWVRLAVTGDRSVFFRGLDELELPVAHAEGKFVPRSAELMAQWEAGGQLALRYLPRSAAARGTDAGLSSAAAHAASGGAATATEAPAALLAPRVPYPDNPNGSLGDVAGVSDATGRVCGLMPHPERYIDPTQHPTWTRRRGALAEAGDGLKVFLNAVEFFA